MHDGIIICTRSQYHGRRQAIELANGHRTPDKSLSIVQAAHRTPLVGHPHDICGTRLLLLPLRRLRVWRWRAPQPGHWGVGACMNYD